MLDSYFVLLGLIISIRVFVLTFVDVLSRYYNQLLTFDLV